MTTPYVHGHGAAEHRRLQDQARTLSELLHRGTRYAPGSSVLEVGCGVGAQTLALAARSPGASFTAVDVSEASLAGARERLRQAGLGNVVFRLADVMELPFADETFDHAFICFLLEHLAEPDRAIAAVQRVLRPGGTLTVVEGDHGLIALHPEDAAARAAIQCQVRLQSDAGGNPLIGRTLYPRLRGAGFEALTVEPCMVYVDGSRPDLAQGFTQRTFTAMLEGIRSAALARGLSDAATFDAGIRALRRTAEPDGVFCYTFFKAVGVKPTRHLRG